MIRGRQTSHRWWRTVAPVTIALVLLPAGGALAASVPAAAPSLQRIVVSFDDARPASIEGAVADAGGEVIDDVTNSTVVVEVPGTDAAGAAAALAADHRVRWAAPDVVLHAALVPNDPCYTGCSNYDQYNLRLVGAERAWDITRGSSTIDVAVLDTGVDSTHPDLAGKIIQGGNHSTSPGAGDDNGHGTHVAGIVAAVTNNGAGVAGLGFNTRVRSIKVLDAGGAGFASGIAKGIEEAITAGSRVINLSLAGDNHPVLRDSVLKAVRAGVVVVAAVGNEASSTPTFPGAYEGVLAVGSSTASDQMSGFSNRGLWVDVVAPGELVVSTLPNGYGVESGTSQSSPLVAATAALMFAVNPGLSGVSAAQLLLEAAVPIAASGSSVNYGRLDAAGAVADAAQAPASTATGYRMVASDGGIFAFGSAGFFGSLGSLVLNKPIVGMASTPTGNGYWLVASDGGIFAFGDAGFHGSLGNLVLNQPIVSMAPTSTGKGYWLAAADGGIFAFGDAPFFGSASTGATPSTAVVAMAASPTGRGYWLTGRDGGVYAFGDAGHLGSTAHITLTRPIVGVAPTATGKGYWLVASDGGIFAFGDAPFHGSTGHLVLNKPVVGMAATRDGQGYWMVASDGGIFAFGNAPFSGSTGHLVLNKPVVGMTA